MISVDLSLYPYSKTIRPSWSRRTRASWLAIVSSTKVPTGEKEGAAGSVVEAVGTTVAGKSG